MINENTGREVLKNLGDAVTNQHPGKWVKLCVTNIWVSKIKATWKCILVSMFF